MRKNSTLGTLIVNKTTKNTFYRTPVLKNGTKYYWRVRACLPAGCKAWTAYRYFTVRLTTGQSENKSEEDWLAGLLKRFLQGLNLQL